MVHLATILSTTAVVATLVPSVVVAVPIQASASEEGLVEREPFLPLLGLGISAVSSIFRKRKRDLESNDLSDIAERAPEPFLPLLGLAAGAASLFRGKRELSADDMELISRLNTDELSELVERNPEPFLPLLGLGISAVSSIFRKRKRDFVEYDEGLDLISRSEPEELGELMARNPEPFLPLLGLGISAVSSIFRKRKRDFIEFDEDVFERDFDQVDELEMREYTDDEMIARGWSEIDELD